MGISGYFLNFSFKEGRGGYHQDHVKHASAGKEKKGQAQEEMTGQHQGGHERVQDGAESKCVIHEDKGRPITTWRRPKGEKTVALFASLQIQSNTRSTNNAALIV